MPIIVLEKKLRKRQLTIQYMAAVIMLALLALSSVIVLHGILKEQSTDASAINMSGRQRMLTQRNALLVYEITNSDDQRLVVKKKQALLTSVNLMEESHQRLITGTQKVGTYSELCPPLVRLYFHQPTQVDKQVKEHISFIRNFLQKLPPEPSKKTEMFIQRAQGPLLDALCLVVAQYERKSNKHIASLKMTSISIFVVTVLFLIVIVIFGFRPMANTVVENESILKNILDSVPIYMNIIDMDYTILYQSNYLIEALGGDSFGRKCFDAYYRNQQPCPDCHLLMGMPTCGITTVEPVGCLDGMDIIVTNVNIIFKGQKAILQIFEDVTERKKTQDLLVKAREEAEHASTMKSDFLANTSHEIRTPLNAIIGLSELALESDLKPRQQDYLEKINRSSLSLLGIINDILDFSKIEAGKLNLEKREFSLDKIMEGLADLFVAKVQEKNIELSIHRHSDVPLSLVGDGMRLHQILVNLVGNSLKFTEQGEIAVTASIASREGDSVTIEFSVKDSGIGIAENKLESLFDNFSQADTSTTRKYGGTGLGLSITKQLVEMMEGNIEVSSTLGQGSTFSFTARFKLLEQETKSLQSPDGVQGLRVLIVDDSATVRQVLCAQIDSFSFLPTAAASGAEALALLADGKNQFDLAIIDWQMPEMDGAALCAAIRQQAEFSSMPILMLTGYNIDNVSKAVGALANDFIHKPVTLSQLFDAIMTVLGYREQNKELVSFNKQVDPHVQESMSLINGAQILLVEDNSINCQVAEEVLSKVNIVPEIVHNGQEALDILALAKADYDAILMDIQMPVMDGFEATRQLRKMGHTVPIIAMTANAMQGDRKKCLDVGMNDYVTKPINRAELFTIMAKWISTTDRGALPDLAQTSIQPDDGCNLPATLPGLNIAKGIKQLNGNDSLYLRLVQQFAQDYAAAVSDIEDALVNGNGKDAERLLHTLKGLAASLGAHELSTATKAAEQAVLAGRESKPLLRQMQIRLTESLVAIDKLVASAATETVTSAAKEAIDYQEAARLLEQLTALLTQKDFQAVNTWQQLAPLLRAMDSKQVTEIDRSMNQFDFEQAMQFLSEVNIPNT
ncbi:MAG: response regulator [Deltaproteobacteria bacterium]|nr:response regulator [Deltaproteobacteria bacterium]